MDELIQAIEQFIDTKIAEHEDYRHDGPMIYSAAIQAARDRLLTALGKPPR